MRSFRPVVPALGIGALLLAAGCAKQPVETPDDPRLGQLQQRVRQLEMRVQRLEQEQPVAAQGDVGGLPVSSGKVSRDELLGDLQALYLERDRLLRRYTPKHPDVMRLDEEISHIRSLLR